MGCHIDMALRGTAGVEHSGILRKNRIMDVLWITCYYLFVLYAVDKHVNITKRFYDGISCSDMFLPYDTSTYRYSNNGLVLLMIKNIYRYVPFFFVNFSSTNTN